MEAVKILKQEIVKRSKQLVHGFYPYIRNIKISSFLKLFKYNYEFTLSLNTSYSRSFTSSSLVSFFL